MEEEDVYILIKNLDNNFKDTHRYKIYGDLKLYDILILYKNPSIYYNHIFKNPSDSNLIIYSRNSYLIDSQYVTKYKDYIRNKKFKKLLKKE